MLDLSDENNLVASKGTIVRSDSTLNKKNHVAIRFVEEGQDDVLCDLNGRSKSSSICNNGSKSLNHASTSSRNTYKKGLKPPTKDARKGPDKSTLADWLPLSLGAVNSDANSTLDESIVQQKDVSVAASDARGDMSSIRAVVDEAPMQV
ncbi:hypothetical protein V6N11_082845 [Hibiscus sabdariffa]|uniref:Uncharacterized protein n=1 Tax=Hibiscus sabdariffa TaxID=183260 RepID=A0ABR2QK33_9ROSI